MKNTPYLDNVSLSKASPGGHSDLISIELLHSCRQQKQYWKGRQRHKMCVLGKNWDPLCFTCQCYTKDKTTTIATLQLWYKAWSHGAMKEKLTWIKMFVVHYNALMLPQKTCHHMYWVVSTNLLGHSQNLMSSSLNICAKVEEILSKCWSYCSTSVAWCSLTGGKNCNSVCQTHLYRSQEGKYISWVLNLFIYISMSKSWMTRNLCQSQEWPLSFWYSIYLTWRGKDSEGVTLMGDWSLHMAHRRGRWWSDAAEEKEEEDGCVGGEGE